MNAASMSGTHSRVPGNGHGMPSKVICPTTGRVAETTVSGMYNQLTKFANKMKTT
ncbi:uncharacterized protein METZ01_LOCUS215356 [marine metagenome]|uniref:Uncharacterized protein n=1 Tax=marine metagenome TaxID=408172 RepID=A0A382FIR4_9ZZZZ